MEEYISKYSLKKLTWLSSNKPHSKKLLLPTSTSKNVKLRG